MFQTGQWTTSLLKVYGVLSSMVVMQISRVHVCGGRVSLTYKQITTNWNL